MYGETQVQVSLLSIQPAKLGALHNIVLCNAMYFGISSSSLDRVAQLCGA